MLCKRKIVPRSNFDVVERLLSDIVISSYELLADKKDERDKLLEIIKKDYRIIEECCCDAYALELLFYTIKNVSSKCSSVDIAEAVYLALSFQKYIELIKSAAKKKTVSISAMKFSLRESCARNLIPILYFKDFKSYDWADQAFIDDAKNIRNNPGFVQVSEKLSRIEHYFANILNFNQITSMTVKLTSDCYFNKWLCIKLVV